MAALKVTLGQLPARFWSKAKPLDNGCWQWTDKPTAKGYGRIYYDGRIWLAHRLAYSAVGPIPDGLVIDHTCHKPSQCQGGSTCPHRLCVNPLHLAIVTPAANNAAGRVAHINNTKTHCPSGHPYDEANTRLIPNGGGRACKACNRIRTARERAARRAAS